MKALILAACLLCPIGAKADIISKIQTITLADIQEALADANAQTPPDTRHAQCWQVLVPWVTAWQGANGILPSKLGLALLMQKTFDLKQLAAKPLVPDAVVTGCALTLYDINMTLAQLTGALGIKAIAIPKLPL